MPIKADKSLRAYYNEIDPYAAQWIRNLMAEGWITKGDVDERSIEDVLPNELAGYDRLHFFAGVAVWDYALNQAGWGRSEIWTGSCPCQPFSAAGKGSGFDDERHLWPAFHHLIKECKPAIVLGEQVASKDADPWIDLVQADVEALGYGFGAIPFPAASVSAPHIRDRLYWVAHTNSQQHHRGRKLGAGWWVEHSNCGTTGWLAHHDSHGCSAQPGAGVHDTERDTEPCRSVGGVADTNNAGPQGQKRVPERSDERIAREGCMDGWMADTELQQRPDGEPGFSIKHDAPRRIESTAAIAGLRGDLRAGPVNGFWSDADWLFCRDGKWRPVEPGTFPLVAGPARGMGRSRTDWHTPAGKEGFGHRAGRLKGYGNAINAEAARVFIECVAESL